MDEHEDRLSDDLECAQEPDQDTIKMFVGQIPRQWDENECRKLFEKYGRVYALNILRDKSTQQSKGCCFVTYYKRKDAIEAQGALHNIETIPGMHHPIQMKPADTENRNERKLFIGQLSKRSTEDEVREMFSRFGNLEDVSVLRDADGRSRGCAFVTFSSRSCAMNATKEMHHSRTMEGCSAPLVVKFADSQKDREIKSKTPISVSSSVGSFGLVQPAGILHQLGAANTGINAQTLTALASLLQPQAAIAGQQNILGLLGNVLSALGKLGQNGQQAPIVTTGAAGGGTATAAGSNQSLQQQLAALLQQLQHGGQSVDAVAQLQQIAQQQQQQQLLLQLQQQQQQAPQATPDPKTPEYMTAYGYQNPATVTSSIQSLGQVHQPIYQSATGVGTTLKVGVDPMQALHSYAFALNPLQQNIGGVGNGDVKGPANSNLFIYHLPQEFGDADLMNTFSPFGTVLSAKVFIDKVTNLSKCFGFVSYDNEISAKNAIAAMNGFQIGSKRLKVQLKNERSHPYGKVA